MSSVARSYDDMAVHHVTVTCFDRHALNTAPVRLMNNFVKACLIDAACRALAVGGAVSLDIADIACGRGQDTPKWAFGARAAGLALTSYFGMDLSGVDTQAAGLLAVRFMERAARVLHAADAGRVPWPLRAASVDVVSCQLALHYLCDTRVHCAHFFHEAARVLRSNGVLLVSFTDGRAIVRRAREAAPARVFRQGFYELDVPPETCAGTHASAFGYAYTFTLHGSVNAVPEYLCHEGAVVQCAAEVGFHWHARLSMPFDALALTCAARPHYAAIAGKMGGNGLTGFPSEHTQAALDAASLYRAVVFAKSKHVLREFQNALYKA